MRVLLVNQFYPPDPAPTGLYLRDLARELRRRGHAVEVCTGRAPYAPGTASGPLDEDDDGVRVRRLGRATDAAPRDHLRRGARAAGFLARVALAAARVDLVVALTSPPFLGVAAALAARRHGARLAHWVMDAYPDALVSHGLVAPRGPLVGLLRALARRAYGRAALVVALGPFMAQRVRALVPARVPVESVELWGGDAGPRPTEARVRAERSALGFADDELVLLYSGNLGLGHRLEEFLEAARRLGPTGPRWVFAGGGARRAQLEAFRRAHPQARIELQPYLDEPGHTLRLLAADVHLASLAEAWQGVIVPSKVQAALALGRPLLFVGPAHNEPAAWVRASGGGWTCAPGDVGTLLAALSAAREPDERARRGAAAAQYARLHFDRARGVARLAELLEAAYAGGASLSR